MPPRASNQVSLWQRGEWVGAPALLIGWRMDFALRSVLVVDAAILKMMGKDDE